MSISIEPWYLPTYKYFKYILVKFYYASLSIKIKPPFYFETLNIMFSFKALLPLIIVNAVC